MRGLIIGLPLSIALWAGLIWLWTEYGWHTVAFVMTALGGAYIVGTIRRDWVHIKSDEWQDGEPVNYKGDK